MSVGYIYIRTNEYWDSYNAYKLGKTENIPDREQTYITSEIKKGNYIKVIEIELKILDKIEKDLQKFFNKLKLHIKFNAGTEFYKKDINDYIIPYLDKHKIKYKILSQDEINNLIRKERLSNNIIEDSDSSNKIIEYIPRDYQNTIINNSYNYFQTNEKGILVIPCGVGKTLISLWITQKINNNTILIGVPNTLLLTQWKEKIDILYNDYPCLIIKHGIHKKDIINFLEKNSKKCIVITTYHSSYKLSEIDFIFDIKINDEMHHLTSINIEDSNNKRSFIKMLYINSKKQLSLTATLKQIDNIDSNIISNDNIEYFGEIIERRCLLWAIKKEIVCDYDIQTIIMDEDDFKFQLEEFNINEDNIKRLFLSAFICLKSIIENHSHHLLIYSNNKENSILIIDYIKKILKNKYFDIDNLYYSEYNSDIDSEEQKIILNNFNESKFGIISCVYCLGEGYDNHKIDGVVFSENMSSNIRIVQSALRASRKNKLEPNKKTKIILPLLNNNNDWLDNENPDYKKIKEVIYQMGLEDETVIEKIKVYKINGNQKKKKGPKDFYEYNDDLIIRIKSELKTINRTALGMSYEKARKIIVNYNIKSKDKYYELCDIDNRLSKEPEIIYKGQFTNWIDYLGIERIYYDFETCKQKINEYLSINPELKDEYLNLVKICNKLCKIDNMFPPNELWVEYYDIKKLEDIIIVSNKKNKKKDSELF